MTWAPRWPLSSRGRIGGHREAGLFPVERSRKQLACALEGPQPPRASLEVVSGVRCPVQCLAHSRGSIDIRWDKGGAFLGSSVSGVCASSQAGCCGGSRGVLWAFSSGLCEMPLLWMRWCGGAGGRPRPGPPSGSRLPAPPSGGWRFSGAVTVVPTWRPLPHLRVRSQRGWQLPLLLRTMTAPRCQELPTHHLTEAHSLPRRRCQYGPVVQAGIVPSLPRFPSCKWQVWV